MKNNLRTLVISIGLSTALASSVVVAQESAKEVANVPFAFHVKNMSLPAGKYEVRAASSPGVIQIADAATGHRMMILTQGRNTNGKEAPRLTFLRYGNEYFLSQVFVPGQSEGYSFSKTAREKELAKQPGQVATATVRIQAE